ncbi:MAG: GGDEF domain-containing protein [Oscillospiraceae bacterium]|nr:GGDEF domain-containing protein [Oscillospiraceae bacterium]
MKSNKLTGILFVIYLLLVVASIAMVPICTALDNFEPEYDFIEFNSWYLDSELTQPVDTSEPSDIEGYQRDKPMSFFAVLPDRLEKGTSLQFKMKNSFTEIYFLDPDGSRELIRERDTVNTRLYGRSVGTVMIDIPLDSTDAGRKMEIVFIPCYADTSCYLDDFKLGDSSDITAFSLSDRSISAAICVIMFSCGILLMVIHFVIKRISPDMSTELFYLGLFAATTSCWALVETKYLNFFEVDTGALHNLSCMILTLIILPLFMFYQRDFGKRNSRIVPFVCMVSIVNYLLCSFLHFSGILDFHDSLTITHISIGIGCAGVIYSTLVRIFKDKIRYKTDAVSVVGMVVIALFALIDILRYRTGGVGDSALFTRMGLLVYIITLGIYSLSYTAEMVMKGTKAELISRLAYEDGLTGMGNRTAYKEHIAMLDNNSEHTFFVFDINNLKYVNDNIGHQTGDKMIIAASKIIDKVFSPIGKCYRIGGDEFICVCESAQDTEKYSVTFYKELTDYAENNTLEFPLMVALGSSTSKKGDKLSEVINIADQNMYSCKAALKQSAKITASAH